MLAPREEQPRRAVRGVVTLPVWQYSYCAWTDWRRFFAAIGSAIRERHYAVDFSLYGADEITDRSSSSTTGVRLPRVSPTTLPTTACRLLRLPSASKPAFTPAPAPSTSHRNSEWLDRHGLAQEQLGVLAGRKRLDAVKPSGLQRLAGVVFRLRQRRAPGPPPPVCCQCDLLLSPDRSGIGD